MSQSGYLQFDPASSRNNAHLWKAVAPFVSLEEQLFAHETDWLGELSEAFVENVLPEASPLGRVA